MSPNAMPEQYGHTFYGRTSYASRQGGGRFDEADGDGRVVGLDGYQVHIAGDLKEVGAQPISRGRRPTKPATRSRLATGSGLNETCQSSGIPRPIHTPGRAQGLRSNLTVRFTREG